jgi:hypothetical protein
MAPSGAPLRLFQPLVFDAKAFVMNDGRAHELDARVVLSDGRITVTPNNLGNPLHDINYNSVVSINYSRGRDPSWASPAGPAVIARAGGGAFSIFRGERHWVAVQTNDRFLILRLGNPDQARRAMAALKERTGKTPVVVDDRKDAR